MDTIGLASLVLTLALSAALAYRSKAAGMVILAAAFVRVGAALFHFYIAPLPDGTVDAVSFEKIAWELAADPWNLVSNFEYSAAYFYSAMMSLPYAIFGRSPLLLQSISVLVGTFGVYLTWVLASELWGIHSARAAAWTVALAPTAIMYSALTMREAYFVLCLLIGILYLARWARQPNARNFIWTTLAFLVGILFHGGMAAALGAFWGLVACREFGRLLNGLQRGNLKVVSATFLAVGLVTLAVILLADPDLPKLGKPSELFGTERYLRMMSVGVRGSAAYPAWMVPVDGFDLVWAVPIRALYLLFSPFVWDVSDPRHFAGLVDGLLYAFLVLGIAANWRRIAQNPAAICILFVAVALIIVFGAGTGNFGAALRHRAKMLPLLAALAAPVFASVLTSKHSLVAASKPLHQHGSTLSRGRRH